MRRKPEFAAIPSLSGRDLVAVFPGQAQAGRIGFLPLCIHTWCIAGRPLFLEYADAAAQAAEVQPAQVQVERVVPWLIMLPAAVDVKWRNVSCFQRFRKWLHR